MTKGSGPPRGCGNARFLRLTTSARQDCRRGRHSAARGRLQRMC
ncbi:hypothetical protein NK6_4045 [Bradyrhizobium diazoefficiens]|uniref:Uncharacterized protein n=1 Tax=Bradyrhizobium diazoefficiens TaxID=1355477 RepID=A0A0E3VUD4_9BRAD|nr:hypothetical protein NK6_4045 [Bradyrhizobium diazoefficiens]